MSTLFHTHAHRPAATQCKDVRTTDKEGTMWDAPVTFVLWRCACGDVYSEELDGSWTLAQITERNPQ